MHQFPGDVGHGPKWGHVGGSWIGESSRTLLDLGILFS